MLVTLRGKKRIQRRSKNVFFGGTCDHLEVKYWSLHVLNTVSLVRSLFDHVTIPFAAFFYEDGGKTTLIILVTLFIVIRRCFVLNCTDFTMVYPWLCTN